MTGGTPPDFDERELHAALEEGRFELFYQPQYAGRDSALVGVEALVRLHGRSGGLIPPGCFIETLERTGLIHDVGRHLFEQGCAHAARWPGLSVAINVSPEQFRDPDLASHLLAATRRARIDPSQIEIEITEGLFFNDPDRAEASLRLLRDAGFSIALDDFGTGYSSLAYLLRFPVNKIKIDRSFIQDVPHDVRSATIVHAIVALSRALGLKIVAEGVETEEQRLFLRTAGCHLLQGFLFSEAVPAHAITDLLAGTAGAAERIAP